MPYTELQELPDKVRNTLPTHAQRIYLKAYNNALQEYAKPQKRRGKTSESQETTAHKVAWAAVKKQYKKEDDSWVKK